VKIWLSAAVLAFPLLVQAAGSTVVVASSYSPHAPAVRLVVPADYVAIPIAIQDESRDAAIRFDQIQRAYRTLTENIAQHADLSVRHGMVSLSPREPSALKSFSGYDAYGGSSAQLYVLGVLKPEVDVFAVTKKIHQVLKGVPLVESTKLSIGSSTLGLDDPEKYRGRLLALIAKSISETRKSLNVGGETEISGLEAPVAAMQLNEREVAVFIHHRWGIQPRR
jgi:hypothetical protein